jgi:hypothetical protein
MTAAESQINRSLLDLFTKLDFRDKNNSGKKKFVGILLAYLISNAAISFNFFNVFDRQSYMVLTLSSGLFLMAILVINDFENLILAGSSQPSLSVLPLSSSSVFRAKILSAVMFISPFAVVSSVPQSVFYYFFERSMSDTLLYFIASFCLAMFAAFLLVFIYATVLLKFKERATMLLTFIQFLFFAFVFYSSTVASSRPQSKIQFREKVSIMDKPGIDLLPQTLFAKGVDEPLFLLMAILGSILLFALCYAFIAGNYLQLCENSAEVSSKREKKKLRLRSPEFLKTFVNDVYLRNDMERSSFYLVLDHLSASRFLRVKYIPYMIMPLMFILIGLIFKIKGMLYVEGASLAVSAAVPILSPSITVILLMSSRMLVSNTKIMDDRTHDTEWIYKSLPISDSNFILKGVSKFFHLTFLFPVLLVLFMVLSFNIGFQAAVLNVMFIGSGIYFFNSIVSLFDKTMPFTVESGKFNSASKLAEIFVSMFVGIILILIQIFAFQNIIFALVITAVFLVLSFLLNRN